MGEIIRKYQIEAIIEQKNVLEGFNGRLDEAEQESAAGRQSSGTHPDRAAK